ncbi:hypothetical protein M9Y10_013817 [Tritrichomonas musculus]|uniref:Uncharacterized protein n=1 Tax=Tritrichomonas musculus TaxID=1915356 RepID=A0ABR2KXU7_9EUKA
MSQKYVKGVKRNQIIQRWLQGVDDPDYEVFPTKKEGKYIVKLRETPLTDKHEVESLVDESNEVPVDEVPVDVTPPNETVKRAPTRKQPFAKQTSRSETTTRTYEQTTNGINLEILEQLRNLGEELRNDRFKKEQKQYIKHVVNKELNKSRIRSKYVPDVFACKASPLTKSNVNEQPTNEQPANESFAKQTSCNSQRELCTTNESTNEQPTNEQPIFRSRIRR